LRCNFASLLSFCAPCIVGARGACPISGAKHRAPTIKAIGLATFYEIIIDERPLSRISLRLTIGTLFQWPIADRLPHFTDTDTYTLNFYYFLLCRE
jgi:hypothetical protein